MTATDEARAADYSSATPAEIERARRALHVYVGALTPHDVMEVRDAFQHHYPGVEGPPVNPSDHGLRLVVHRPPGRSA